MTDISFSRLVLVASSGSLKIQDSLFENINSSLFFLSDVTTSINNVTFNKISCQKSFNSFCLLKVTSSSQVIEIANSALANFYSNVDLISLSDCTQVLLSNFTAQNILKDTQENLDQIFVLSALNVQSLNVSQSHFSRIGFSSLKAKNTFLKIKDSTFSNRLKNDRRLLSQSINDNLYSAKLNQPIQFMILDSSNSTLTNISFAENSFNTLVNGGAVQILGSGGVHTFTGCIFENNQASNGAALYVKGQAGSISILKSQFDNNQASGNGGVLFFADQSLLFVISLSLIISH